MSAGGAAVVGEGRDTARPPSAAAAVEARPAGLAAAGRSLRRYGAPARVAVDDDGVTLSFYCRHCRARHRHGRPYGHRAAHCANPASPYRRGGYVLVKIA